MERKFAPNSRQAECIKTLNGSVMVLAGPGTGKTFTVIQRIKYMLEQGIEPERILCLTFSDAAANEMRQRLIKEMGIAASGVDVYTYHAFCNDIIKQFPDEFNMTSSVNLITETISRDLMKQTIDEANLKFFVPSRADKYNFVPKFINYVQKLKSLRLAKDKYLSFIDSNSELTPRLKELESEIYEREQAGKTQNKGRYAELEKIKTNIEKAKELWLLYEIYSQKMSKNNLIDFADMINLVIDKFEEDKAFLAEISNKYDYFLVDEYQDTNSLQNSIIFNLIEGNKCKNIFVVGDDDQIIYGFQGAKSDNLENFLVKYPQTKVICLSENNRSAQNILDLSYKIASQNENRIENNEKFSQYNISKKLIAKNEKVISQERKVRRLQFGHVMQEYNSIAEDIVSLINSDNCPLDDNGNKKLSQIAIIAKKGAECDAYAEMLQGKNIPCQLANGKNIFTIRSSILVYFYLKAMYNPALNSDKLFPLLMAEPFKIDYEDYEKLLKENRVNKKDFITNMKRIKNWQNGSKIENFLEIFKSLSEFAQTNSLRTTVIEVLNRTGILTFYLKNEKNKYINILGIKTILDVATDLERTNPTASICDFIQYLDDSFENDIEILTGDNDVIQNAVQIMTYHKSKGREFEHVYLPNLISDSWENFSMPGEYKFITDEILTSEEKQAKKDEELTKLLFVGVTRAKYALTLSFADKSEKKAQQVTKYLECTKDFDFDSKQFECNEEEFFDGFMKTITTEALDNRKKFESEIKDRVKDFEISPSMMNKYLNCPRQFFYSGILRLDVTDSNWDAANYGTVIHFVLENLVRKGKENGDYLPLEKALELFNCELNKHSFSSDAVKENYQKRGVESLTKYYPKFVEIQPDNVEEIEYEFAILDENENLIKGKIDRIEKFSDGTYGLYDYKTSKPVSEKQILPEQSREDYFNQLCFYKYGFEKLTGKTVSDTGIIYIEEPQKSVHKKLTNADNNYIEGKIKTSLQGIKNLEFDKPTKITANTCKYCEFKRICNFDVI